MDYYRILLAFSVTIDSSFKLPHKKVDKILRVMPNQLPYLKFRNLFVIKFGTSNMKNRVRKNTPVPIANAVIKNLSSGGEFEPPTSEISLLLSGS